MYIIVYNAESDFILCPDKAEAEFEIKTLIESGYAHNDIQVYQCFEVNFKVRKTDVAVEVVEKIENDGI